MIAMIAFYLLGAFWFGVILSRPFLDDFKISHGKDKAGPVLTLIVGVAAWPVALGLMVLEYLEYKDK